MLEASEKQTKEILSDECEEQENQTNKNELEENAPDPMEIDNEEHIAQERSTNENVSQKQNNPGVMLCFFLLQLVEGPEKTKTLDEMEKGPEETKTLDEILEGIYVSDDETEQPAPQEEFSKLEDYDILSDLQVSYSFTSKSFSNCFLWNQQHEDAATAVDPDEESVYMEEN